MGYNQAPPSPRNNWSDRACWRFRYSTNYSILKWLVSPLQVTVHALNQRPGRCYFSHSPNSGIGSFQYYSHSDYLIPVLPNFEFYRFGGVRGMLPPRDTTIIPLNWKFETTTWLFRVPYAIVWTVKERGRLSTGVIDPDRQREGQFAATEWGQEGQCMEPGILSGAS